MYFWPFIRAPCPLHLKSRSARGDTTSKLRGQCQLDLKKLQLARDETGSSVVPLTVPWGDLFLKRVGKEIGGLGMGFGC